MCSKNWKRERRREQENFVSGYYLVFCDRGKIHIYLRLKKGAGKGPGKLCIWGKFTLTRGIRDINVIYIGLLGSYYREARYGPTAHTRAVLRAKGLAVGLLGRTYIKP